MAKILNPDQPRCGTCRHWGNKEDAGEEYRACQLVVHQDSYPHPDDIADKDARAHTCDGSDYTSALLAASDFGCVHHEPEGGDS